MHINDMLILVDETDQEIGYEEKMEAHIYEHLHRAFSLFIYNTTNKKLLLHQRAVSKYHSGGLWTNSCCSHPRKGESLEQAVIRRTKEELGVELHKYCDQNSLLELGSFQYYQKYQTCAESEIDHVFIALVEEDLPLCIEASEIQAVKWVSLQELQKWQEESPDAFTAWFPNAAAMVLKYIMASA